MQLIVVNELPDPPSHVMLLKSELSEFNMHKGSRNIILINMLKLKVISYGINKPYYQSTYFLSKLVFNKVKLILNLNKNINFKFKVILNKLFKFIYSIDFIIILYIFTSS